MGMILHLVKILSNGIYIGQHLGSVSEVWYVPADCVASSLCEPLRGIVVDEISTKHHLPFYEGKSRLIFQLFLYTEQNKNGNKDYLSNLPDYKNF